MSEPAQESEDARLIRSVLTVMYQPCKNQLLGNTMWSNVGEVFGLGSTSSHRLCERFGFNPDTKVRRVFRGGS